MAGLKLNFPKLHDSSETANPPARHSPLDKGQTGLNFKLSYTESNGRKEAIKQNSGLLGNETFRDNAEFCVKVTAWKPLSSKRF